MRTMKANWKRLLVTGMVVMLSYGTLTGCCLFPGYQQEANLNQ